ncbi:MAG: class I SAM-dependent methyltransferase [Actinomycetaceae bacterium]|nr:class I SAM-dependent methyltransferase [Actinomycetaceae bacterium]
MAEIFHGDVRVPWYQARDENMANWNDRAKIHRSSYGLEKYVKDSDVISAEVRKDLPLLLRYLGRESIQDVRLAHLQCHIGTDTVSLARLGADVTGLDFSAVSLQIAASFARDCGVNVHWVEADVMDAATAIGYPVDVVYTTIGTICWLQDLTRWAQQISELLSRGGIFFIRDAHPMAYTTEWVDDRVQIRYRYFENGHSQMWNDTASYSGDGVIEHSRNYDFPHSLSEIITALLGVGLRLEYFSEGKELPWPLLPIMETDDNEQWHFPPALAECIPCSFTLVCSR